MQTDHWLDSLSRRLAQTRSRREGLRQLGALLAGAALTVLVPNPARAAATCSKGKTDCGDTCVDLKRDEQHCGACGNVCPADAKCRKGKCRCRKGKEPCGTECVDLKNNEQHCGACFTSCPPGGCAKGECRACSRENICRGVHSPFCCDKDATCCAAAGAECCPKGSGCCFGTRGSVGCCPDDTECCNLNCCEQGTRCCGVSGVCCPNNQTCCNIPAQGSPFVESFCCPSDKKCGTEYGVCI